MNRATLIALGVLVTVFTSLLGLVLLPNWQYRSLAAYKDDAGETWPSAPFGEAVTGRAVYIDLGCVYCHSQQVRPEGYGADIARGWGMRRTVARDYIHDSPPLLGTMRTGPDLANIGARQPSREWHLLHLYDPAITSPGSTMPRYPFLFSVIRNGGSAPPGAVRLPAERFPEPAWVVPTLRGAQLAGYLRSLNHNYELPEAR
ncbi:MAG: cbb3-type cytochrome c oxidase subunit II [Bryobacteraceae bacterium]